jgi:hypothetical protein
MKSARELNYLWHSVLPLTVMSNLLRNKRKIAYISEHDGIAYSVAIWTTPVAANRMAGGFDMLELRRFAISEDSPKNTASRILAIMSKLIKKKWPEVNKLVSYQSNDHHDGTIYKAAGWVASVESKYSEWHKGKRRNVPQSVSSKTRWEKELK